MQPLFMKHAVCFSEASEQDVISETSPPLYGVQKQSAKLHEFRDMSVAWQGKSYVTEYLYHCTHEVIHKPKHRQAGANLGMLRVQLRLIAVCGFGLAP